MVASNPKPAAAGLYQRYKRLSTSKKVILIVFVVWLVQALPKWTVAVGADGELSAKIMRIFLTPQADVER